MSPRPSNILGGYLLIHSSSMFSRRILHFGEETHADSVIDTHVSSTAILGLALHAFMDGVAIGSAFIASPALGVIVFAAIMLQQAPRGVSRSRRS